MAMENPSNVQLTPEQRSVLTKHFKRLEFTTLATATLAVMAENKNLEPAKLIEECQNHCFEVLAASCELRAILGLLPEGIDADTAQSE